MLAVVGHSGTGRTGAQEEAGHSSTVDTTLTGQEFFSLSPASSLHLPKQGSLPDALHAIPSETNDSPLYIKTPLVLARHDPPLGSLPPNTPLSAPPPWGACASNRERGAKLTR